MSVTVLLLGVALVDPLGAMSGFSDNGPYSPIKEALSKVDHPRTLMLASFDDFYAIESNYIARAETSDTFVEKGYKTVLVAASFGEQSFNLDDLMQIGILAQSLTLHNPVASRLNRSIKRASIICRWD